MKIVQKFIGEINGVQVTNLDTYFIVGEMMDWCHFNKMVFTEEMALVVYKFIMNELNIDNIQELLDGTIYNSQYVGYFQLFHAWVEEDTFDDINEKLKVLIDAK